MNINEDVHGVLAAAPKNRLPVFISILDKADNILELLELAPLPRILPPEARSQDTASLAEATWRELLLGEGDAYFKTIQAHKDKAKESGARSSPVSPHSF